LLLVAVALVLAVAFALAVALAPEIGLGFSPGNPTCHKTGALAPGIWVPPMRLNPQTYALTAITHQRHRIFQRTTNADLMIATLFRYRDQSRYLLHGFVVMPDHIHTLLTPNDSIEKTVQLIKGGFSFSVRGQFKGEVWQASYHAHRVTDAEDYRNQLFYIANNPIKRQLADYPFLHTRFADRLDPHPEHWA
jgi:putative transposase